MTLDQIYYFIEIAKTGSMSQAANVLHVSQPNISMTIKSLENEVGYTLFNRIPRGVELTRQGAEFLYYAESIVRNVQEIQAIREPNRENLATFAISAQYVSVAIYPLEDMYHLFEQQAKIFTIRQNNFSDVVDDVASGYSDLGLINISVHQTDFINALLERKGVTFTPIDRREMALAVSSSHPLCNVPNPKWSDFYTYPLAIVEYSDKAYFSVQDVKHLSFDSFKSKLYVQDMLFLYYLMTNLNAVTFLSIGKHHDLDDLLKKYQMHIKVYPMDDPVVLSFGYIRQTSKPLTYLEQYFINALKKHLG
ncbi:MAG: hypothetical protein PWP51_1374 [Clostridiales bacterium]|jgi:DNA-binding transcriptional LysR family regulator|nr:hypothetical protein [Clostridiales bacterium]MDN5298821.1 hypothetical protein [Clostridiales bacterium]